MKFQKGQSGNPGGRPKASDDVKELAREHGPGAIAKLAEWMSSDNPKASVSAAQALLDRGYGKAVQAVQASGEIEHRYVARVPQVCQTIEEWQERAKTLLNGPAVEQTGFPLRSVPKREN
jgi:hypothetical protein